MKKKFFLNPLGNYKNFLKDCENFLSHCRRQFSWKNPKIAVVVAGIFFLLVLEIFSGLAIVLSHSFLGTPKRLSIFRFHPFFTGENIAQYESSWTQTVPVLGYTNRTHVSDECGMTTDQYGFIHNGDKSRIITPEKFTIFIVGGSTVAGHGSSCNDQTISAHLEKLLNEYYSNIQVINAGVPGYYSPQELLKIMHQIMLFDPDVIISFGGTNDFIQKNEPYKNQSEAYYITKYHRQLYDTLEGSKSLFWSIKNLIYNVTKFTEYTYTRFVIEKGISYLAGRAASPSKSSVVDNVKRTMGMYQEIPENVSYSDSEFEIEEDRKIERYVMYIRETNALATGMGVKYYYILQPVLFTETRQLPQGEQKALSIARYAYFRKDGRDALKRARYFWERTDEALKKNSMNYYNFTNIFSDEKEVYSDHVHYNDEGNALIAAKMYEILRADQVIAEGFKRP